MAAFVYVWARQLITAQMEAWVAVTVETSPGVDAELLAGVLAGYTLINVITGLVHWIVGEPRGALAFVRTCSVLTLI